MGVDFLTATMKVIKKDNIFNVLKENNIYPRIPYPDKISFWNDKGIYH